MTRREAVWRLEELAHEIYNILDEMKAVLKEVAPEEFELAKVYWMAHIDGALFNSKGWRRVSSISLRDTITTLEREEVEDEEEEF